ncbi:MAG: ribosomal-protein-alanine N-acetyltransferase [Thermoplasmata archaeon]|nr:MAG: ribosomal-protein-alanine N-acetyltransferase [Thermoplasmata archaeon]RLF64484.1 MAG: ribosomal-protein-alanine N-acetyltransferase [Thermoplasmata archaeon]
MIRRCTEEDIPQVAEIENLSFSRPYPAFVFKKYLRARFLVHEEEGKITGYIIGVKMGSKGIIISLAVHPEYRGKGHGKKLIEELVRIMDAGIIELQVRRSNTEALKFYQSVGFERKGILPAYYGDGEDAVVMFMKKG